MVRSMALARRHEQDRLAAAAGAAGAADAVHVAFGVVGNVVVQHVADALDVEAACGDVGGDDDVELAVLQPLHGALALRLRHVAVHRRGGEAARGQLLGQLFGGLLGAGEHDHRLEGSASRMRVSASSLCMPETSQKRWRMFAVVVLAAIVTSRGLRRWVWRCADARRHGRREQRDLALAGVFCRIASTSSMKPMRSISSASSSTTQRSCRQIQRAAFEVVDDAAGRADHDVGAALEPVSCGA
jgi:hypothetical protein